MIGRCRAAEFERFQARPAPLHIHAVHGLAGNTKEAPRLENPTPRWNAPGRAMAY